MGFTAKLTEKQFAQQVIALARLRGWRVAHFRPGRVLRGGVEKYETPVAADGKGFPDLVCIRGTRCIAVELKVGKNQATREQMAWLSAFNGANVESYIWRPESWADHVERILA